MTPPASSGGMDVDTDVLLSSARSVGQTAGRIAGHVDALRATVTSGSPWGGDEPGTLFGAAYTAVLSHALACFGSHVELLDTAAQGLVAWAGDVSTAEQAGVQSFDHIAHAL